MTSVAVVPLLLRFSVCHGCDTLFTCQVLCSHFKLFLTQSLLITVVKNAAGTDVVTTHWHYCTDLL